MDEVQYLEDKVRLLETIITRLFNAIQGKDVNERLGFYTDALDLIDELEDNQ